MNFGAKSILLELFVEQPDNFTKEELMHLKSLEAHSYVYPEWNCLVKSV